MATERKSKKVKMFGTGNFTVDGTLYPFRNGEEVTALKLDHVPFLEAEAKRKEANALKSVADKDGLN